MNIRHTLTAPLLSALVFAACEHDAYDTGEGGESLFRAEFVEAHTRADAAIAYVETDDGQMLSLATPVSQDGLRPDTLYRATMIYKPASDGWAECQQLAFVPTPRPKPLKQGETLHTDPVRFESAWLSPNGRYINLGLYAKVGDMDNQKQGHVVGIVPTDTTAAPDGRRTIRMTFYHDSRSMPEYYSQRLYVSIPADTIRADTVEIKINTFDGNKTVKLKIKN